MEVATYKNDVWGREVLLGVSWDLLWLVIAAALIGIAAHAVYAAMQQRGPRPASSGERLQRHHGIDRLFHWIMAISVLLLLLTGVLPIVGVHFAWLTVHWVAGLVLTLIVLLHIVRSIFWQDLESMRISARDLQELSGAGRKPGKYSLAQKAMHATITLLTALVIGSGLAMFAVIDTPWWERSNALSEAALGWVFLVHGLSTLALIAVISMHVYFGLRPEKLFYTRSMLQGWISKDELAANHDPEKWAPDESA